MTHPTPLQRIAFLAALALAGCGSKELPSEKEIGVLCFYGGTPEKWTLRCPLTGTKVSGGKIHMGGR